MGNNDIFACTAGKIILCSKIKCMYDTKGCDIVLFRQTAIDTLSDSSALYRATTSWLHGLSAR